MPEVESNTFVCVGGRVEVTQDDLDLEPDHADRPFASDPAPRMPVGGYGAVVEPAAPRWRPRLTWAQQHSPRERLDRALRLHYRRLGRRSRLMNLPAQRRREGRQTRRSVASRSTQRTSAKSPPGEPDPPPSLRRLEGGGERSRDSSLNRAWLYVLEVDLSPVELETLGEYCRIRSVWAGRWAA